MGITKTLKRIQYYWIWLNWSEN